MTPLIIDTDVALGVIHEGRPRDIDDGFALVEAINSDALNLVGVTCVFGNGPLPEVERVARELVELKQAAVPVVAGASENMDQNNQSNAAVDFLAEQLRSQKLSIAAIGPLTNIGLLVRDHPDVLGNIEQVIIVAGRSLGAQFYIGDAGPVRDFNFENDVTATELLMQSGVPVVSMGFELTSQVCVTAQDLEGIRQHGDPTARYFYDNSMAWCDYWTNTFPEDAGFHPWDSAAVAWLLNRDWFSYERRYSRISRDPDLFECDVSIEGPGLTYCTGFAPGGAEAFVRSVIANVY